ncbi:MAG: long-chain-fatty-acid--CoA ligase [Myxococcota bacterium]
MTATIERPPFSEHLDYFAEHKGDDAALVFHDRVLTWRDLRTRTRRNAAGQKAEGLTAGARSAYYGKNHTACMETIYAAGMSGAVCAVVNWRLSPEEIHYALNDADAEVVFVAAEFVPVIEQIKDRLPKLRKFIVVDGEGEDSYESWLSRQQPLAEPTPAPADEGWFQLYTSGTTGFPKGAVLTREGVGVHADSVGNYVRFEHDKVAMVAMPLYHVGGLTWALTALSYGLKNILIDVPMPAALLDDLTKYEVTHSFFVPALFQAFQMVPGLTERRFPTLEYLLYGASPMPLPLLLKSLEVFPCKLTQVYGMTEMSGVVTILDDESHRDQNVRHRLLSAGRAIDSCAVKVVDPSTLEPVPAGTLGEVMVKSSQRMHSYYNRAEATEKAFEGEWYRSGDAGKLDEDGYLYISDRIKDMIISGGENIYPAEIERVLVQHPAVREVAVIGVPSDKWVETPKAVVALADETATDEDLLDYCRARLAHYKCPTSFDRVEALPRNATGKVLKRELRAPYWEGRDRTIA